MSPKTPVIEGDFFLRPVHEQIRGDPELTRWSPRPDDRHAFQGSVLQEDGAQADALVFRHAPCL